MDVSVHRADRDEKIAAYRLAYESWGDDRPIDEWVDRRLESPRHNRADWWVLTRDDGEVAASLGCYDLDFRYRGETVGGVGIGAVHTAPEHRSQGYATKLCERVHVAARESGDTFAFLYSDIEPDFYRDLDYEVTSDRRFDATELRDLAEGGPRSGLHRIDPDDQLDELVLWYDEAHDDTDLALERDREYWRHAVDERPDDRFFGVSAPNGRETGYVRVRENDGALQVLECLLPEAEARTEAGCYRALADLALARRWDRISQHFAPPRGVLSHFDDNRRDLAITMICPLDDDVTLEENWLREHAQFWQGDRF